MCVMTQSGAQSGAVELSAQQTGMYSSQVPFEHGLGNRYLFANQKRRVNCIEPLEAISKRGSLPRGQLMPLTTHQSGQIAEDRKKKSVLTEQPIPPTSLDNALKQKTSVATSGPQKIPKKDPSQHSPPAFLIKAYPAHATPFTRRPTVQAPHKTVPAAPPPPAPTGSWTERQLSFNTLEPPRGLTAKETPLRKGKNGVILGHTPKKPEPKETQLNDEDMAQAAWRFRFKKKWIREELHARKQDFPDDPDYEDKWEQAGDFIVKHGYKTAMQAAFMGADRESRPERLFNTALSSFESLSFDESDDEEPSSYTTDTEAAVLSRAATLIHMTKKVNAIVVAR